jgi:hypothetical protein
VSAGPEGDDKEDTTNDESSKQTMESVLGVFNAVTGATVGEDACSSRAVHTSESGTVDEANEENGAERVVRKERWPAGFVCAKRAKGADEERNGAKANGSRCGGSR